MKFHFLTLKESEINTITSLLSESIGNPSVNENFKSRLKTSSTIAAPHTIYVIDLESLKADMPVKLSAIGKRYLISNELAVTGGAEISSKENSDASYSLHDNHYNADTDKALTMFETQGHPDDEFNVGFVKIPALHIGALFMEGTTSSYFIALDQVNEALNKYQSYTPDDFYRILRKLAEEFDDQV